jgi:hypothetical protein
VTAEAQLVKILEEQAEQFEAAKVSAKATLAGYVNPDDYSEENRHAIEEILASAGDRIDVAATITQINTIVADTKTALDGVVTSLVEKSNAKIELDDYPVYENYSEDRKTEIQDLIAAGKAAIDQATTSAGVSSAVAACKTAIDQVPILEEEEQLELAEYISSKVVELKNYADMSRYTIENQEKVQEIMDRYEPLIKNAESIYQAGALFRDAKAEINTIEKLPAPAGCSFVPAASTFFAMFAALAALGYLWLRRR